ncbi:MAG: hypothetical protein NT166_02335 [Candidatus Aminicenantes bacterium]|nr:hypothetical protein [Candidatus Aminicenantes bacterium]
MDIAFNVEIVKKGKWYIARAPELDFVTQGTTAEEARKNIIELVEIQFEEMREMGSLENYLEECGKGTGKKISSVTFRLPTLKKKPVAFRQQASLNVR